MASKGDIPISRREFADFVDGFVTGLNDAFKHMSRRLDDIERRLEHLEGKVDSINSTVNNMSSAVHVIKNDTRVIHPMFELVRTDGAEIGELKLRVDKLEKGS